MKTALTIAGSDSSGGAGVQADIKTMTMNGVYAMSAITALTAQNTMGVEAVMEVTPEFLERQLVSIFSDIYPDAVKIGMVPSPKLIRIISEKLEYYHAKNIVIDPVMFASSGLRLIHPGAIEAMKDNLFRHATLLTPNLSEATTLSGIFIKNEEDMIKATKVISEEYGCAVLCKGGHSENNANDLLYENKKYRWYTGERIHNRNSHGTGCTLSSAITAGLAKGETLEKSILVAKEYVSGALKSMLDLGKGSGPMNHMWHLNQEDILR